MRNLHEVEKAAVRRVLVEERSRYCTFIACLKPVLGEEISLVSELQQLEEVRQTGSVAKEPQLLQIKSSKHFHTQNNWIIILNPDLRRPLSMDPIRIRTRNTGSIPTGSLIKSRLVLQRTVP